MIDSAFAQTANTAASSAPGMGMAGIVIQVAAIGALFYFLIIYPQGKERKKREALLNGMQRGDRVLTRGGVYGIVADIKEQLVILKISENTKIEVEKSYVESVVKNP